ncbi:MAG: dihydropteroate synthase [Proteobacteria bacterium]|nr:dihydropteroate synthase [Pseudomonadota bacterium]MBU1449568.1 dihydropteroate synthase [Pseudomonadota bacterium]MBU2470577.1 dihydropteroate synthase [Pseudomonadota bacterium]MBU2516865.1 dihydropteroate synthase [Pseudomonadota bacterium]
MFEVIGERINTTRKDVNEAVSNRDANYIQEDVKAQQAGGATYIDVNAGSRAGSEKEDMAWLLKVVQQAAEVPLCLDSPSTEVLEIAYSMVQQRPMVNSISLETSRYEPMLSFLRGKDCDVVALCMDDSGTPSNPQEVVARAVRLTRGLESVGIKQESIRIDPVIQPISTGDNNSVLAMESVRGIMEALPGVHTICGLSNVSFGLPQRKGINRIFLTLLLASGLDGAILDPLDVKIMSTLRATRMLLGQDCYCRNFLSAVRAGNISL